MSLCNIYAWGANSHGQLGLGFQSEQSSTPQKLDLSKLDLDPSQICKISGGAGHTIILDSNGNCHSCGWNYSGQLGLSSTKNHELSICKIQIPNNEQIIDLACGWDSTIALSKQGNIFGWGSNAYGQLGVDANMPCFQTPFKITIGERVTKVAMGLRHSTIVTENGYLYVTGAGSHGQLGLLNSNGSPFKQVNEFTKVPGLSNVKEVSCGQYYTIVLTKDNQLFGFGSNKFGQLVISKSLKSKISSPMELRKSCLLNLNNIFCGWTHCISLTENGTKISGDGKVVSWGRNTYGQLGRREDLCQEPDFVECLSSVKQISVGSEHNVALTSDGRIFTWGWNEHGNCGNSDTKDVLIPAPITLPCSRVRVIGTGAGHSFAVVEEDEKDDK